MLDRKTKDIDASIELLEDRKKADKIFFYIFFIVGWIIAGGGIFLVPYKYDELLIGAGICLLIFATWFLNALYYLNIIIMMKREKEEKNK